MADAASEREELVEVYRCTLELEVNRVIDELLAPAGVECFVHDRTSHSLPAPSSGTGDYFVAVPRAQAAQAREILAQARSDGELDEASGRIVG